MAAIQINASPDIHQCSLHYLTRDKPELWPLMLGMQYHVSVNLEIRMMEFFVNVLFAMLGCSMSGPAWLDNLSLSSLAISDER